MASDRRLNILVVDRDEDSNVETKSLLTYEGHHAQVLTDPHQAVSVIAQGSFQVVLIDTTPPDHSGTEFLRKIRSTDPDVLIVGMTAVPEATVSTALSHDFDTLLKPLDLDELRAAIHSAIVEEEPPIDSESRLRALGVRAKHLLMHFPPSRVALRAMCRARLVPHAVWSRLPVEQRFEIPFAPDISFLYESLDGDAIGRTLYLFGAESYEFETTAVFARLARKASVVLDIGANTGLFTLIACAANPNSEVIAFEPVDRVRDVLAENIEINGWSSRCEIRHEAVSDTVGEATFHVPHANVPSSARLKSAFRGHRGEKVVTRQITVDSLATSRVDLVKIDVEGFEDCALRGMRETIARWAPDFIIECNRDGPYHAIDEIMREAGYFFHHLRDGGPEHVDRIVPDESEKARNFLLSRRPPESLFN
jgi:FkbM family methyltransferase